MRPVWVRLARSPSMGATRWRKPRSAKWRAQSLHASAARRRRALPSGGTRSKKMMSSAMSSRPDLTGGAIGAVGVTIRFDSVLGDPGPANGIRRPRWPRAGTVNEIPSGVDGVSFTVHPGCPARAPRSLPPPRPASPEVTALCTCAVLPPEAVVHVSSTAPRRARVPPSVAGSLGTYSPRNGRRTRGAVPWRARAAAADASSPWASIMFSSEITAAAASTNSPSQRCRRASAASAMCCHC
ncbi:hypothetical protein PAHAL_9G605000 [Panicum hallii]|uniref:Uncharacterized protein n=1 Tax=Panicum hallii TaxID=206008 RepID=A0A2S3IU77_9POAL|nr:hypothetical protein PAHAL_9G605000 [Panicum hallii]PAN51579.1 hypothetical protein PAHAL_9G605000 [Panicum hallii]